MKKKILKSLVLFLAIFGIAWIGLTWYVQSERSSPIENFGSSESENQAFLIYNPDPFYSLDKQVLRAFAEGLATQDWDITIITVHDFKKVMQPTAELYVFCANTYNWAPDRPIKKLLDSGNFFNHKDVVAITLGSGSTVWSQQALERIIIENEGNIVGSEVFWLMRPNDEMPRDISNVRVAREKSIIFGTKLAAELNHRR